MKKFIELKNKVEAIEDVKVLARELKKDINKLLPKGVKVSVTSTHTWYTKQLNVKYNADEIAEETAKEIEEIVAIYTLNIDYSMINGRIVYYTSSKLHQQEEEIKRQELEKQYQAELAAKEAEYKANVKIESIENYSITNVVEKNIFVTTNFPNCNKNNTMRENSESMLNYGSYNQKCKITDIVTLGENEYNYFIYNLLEDYKFLENKGGCECYQDENKKWINEYDYCVLIVCPGKSSLVINPHGYSYARYAGVLMSVVSGLDVISQIATETAPENSEQKETEEIILSNDILDIINQPTQEQPTEQPEQKNIDVKVIYNQEKNGVELYFHSMPSDEIRNQLKTNGFRWHRMKKCWYAKQNDDTTQVVSSLVEEIKEDKKEDECYINQDTIEINTTDFEDLLTVEEINELFLMDTDIIA